MSSWRRSAAEAAFAVLAAVLCGCGHDDGRKSYADGLAAYARHDFAKAERYFQSALKADPAFVSAWVSYAQLKLDRGELPASREAVHKALALEPGAVDAALVSAQLDYHAKDYKSAVATYRRLAEDAKLDAATRAAAWAGAGAVEMTRNAREEARIDFLRALRFDRRNAAARYHLGRLYRDSFGYPEAALDQFRAYVRLEKPMGPRAQKVQRDVIPDLEKEIARKASETPGVSTRNSTAATAALAKAEAARQKKNLKEATALYAEALKNDPLSAPAAEGLAEMTLKTDTSAAGQRRAFQAYRQACSLKPNALGVHLSAGALALRLGQHATAVELYSRALAADPNSVAAADGLVRAWRASGRTTGGAAYVAWRDVLSPRKK